MVATQCVQWAAMIGREGMLTNGVDNGPFKSLLLIHIVKDVVVHG